MTHPSAERSIAVYVELLSNLRQLSVVASLPSLSDSTTSASFSDGGLTLTVRHQGVSQSLRLPERPLASAIQVPAQASAELTWRLRLPPLGRPPQRFTLEDQPLPWSARDVLKGSPVKCRACGEFLVKEDCIMDWKDLPSENWAEMMEFWHCHKPVDHDHPAEGAESDGTATKKGYGANNIISAQEGIGLINVTSFVLSKTDCSAVSFSTSAATIESSIDDLKVEDAGPTEFLHVACKACEAEVGVLNVATQAISLFKWAVGCETAPPGPAPDISECLAATIMATISKSGSAKAVIAPHLIGNKASQPSGLHSLYVWVLNSNVVYATSKMAQHPRNLAIKLLFKSLPVEEGNDIVDAMNSDVQELTLPTGAIRTIAQTLETSNGFLPQRERMFQDWQVGLLHRWK